VKKRTKDKLIAILILVGLVGSGAVLGGVVSSVIWKIKESRLNHELRNRKKDIENLQKRLQKIEQGKIEVIATAYSSRECETDDTPFITASNKKVRWGIIAMDKVPFGTKVYIPYFKKTFVVEDRGSAIKGNRIDIWFPSTQEAYKFGVKKLICYVIGR